MLDDDYNAIIASTRSILIKNLPDSSLELKRHLNVCMKAVAPLLLARTEAQHQLAIDRERFRHPKDKELTDFDRQTMLASQTAPTNKTYEELKGLEELLNNRINALLFLGNQLSQ
jgi:hypothetical protein